MKKELTVLCVLVVLWTAVAGRNDAKLVPPVTCDGVIYSVPQVGLRGGVVEACDEATGAKLWSRRIYGVEYSSEREEESQRVAISALSITNDQLFIVNEANHAFMLDPKTRDVTILGKDMVLFEPLSGTSAGINISELSAPARMRLVCTLLRVDRRAFEELAKHGDVDAAQLLSLWQAGQGCLLARPEMTLTAGHENTVKSIREIIYPTELAFPDGCGTNRADRGGMMPVPANFDMQEIGVVMYCTGEVLRSDKAIRLIATVIYSEEPTWKTYTTSFLDPQGNSVEVRFDQPFFPVYEFSNTVDIQTKKTVLLGGLPTADKEGFVFALLTGEIIETGETDGDASMK